MFALLRILSRKLLPLIRREQRRTDTHVATTMLDDRSNKISAKTTTTHREIHRIDEKEKQRRLTHRSTCARAFGVCMCVCATALTDSRDRCLRVEFPFEYDFETRTKLSCGARTHTCTTRTPRKKSHVALPTLPGHVTIYLHPSSVRERCVAAAGLETNGFYDDALFTLSMATKHVRLNARYQNCCCIIISNKNNVANVAKSEKVHNTQFFPPVALNVDNPRVYDGIRWQTHSTTMHLKRFTDNKTMSECALDFESYSYRAAR